MQDFATESEVARDLTVQLPNMSPHINAAIVAALMNEYGSAEDEDDNAIDAIMEYLIGVERHNMGDARFMRMVAEARKQLPVRGIES